jgi:type I restriction enzyme S subunit
MTKPLRLAETCLKIGSGATPRGGKDAYPSWGPYSLIRSQNVHNDGFYKQGLAFISEEQAHDLRNVAVQEGDVLLNITGDSVARACQVDPDVLPARVNQHVAIIRPDPEKVDARFLRYFLVAPQTQKLMLGLASAGATRNALTKSMIEAFQLPPVDIDTQRIVGATLGSLDGKIQLNRRTSETLEAMAQAIFGDWFIDFGPVRRKLAGVIDPVEIMGGFAFDPARAAGLSTVFPDSLGDSDAPMGWKVLALSDVAEQCKGAVDPQRTPEVLFEHYSLPAYDSAEEPAYDLGTTIKSNKTPIPSECVLVSKLNPEILRVWLPGNPNGKPQIASTEFLVFRPKPGCGRGLLYFLFHDPTVRQIMEGMVTGTSKSHQRISPPALLQTKLIIGDRGAFAAFEELVEPMLRRILSLRAENRTLAETRDYLLPRLMSGEVRARDVTPEVAA